LEGRRKERGGGRSISSLPLLSGREGEEKGVDQGGEGEKEGQPLFSSLLQGREKKEKGREPSPDILIFRKEQKWEKKEANTEVPHSLPVSKKKKKREKKKSSHIVCFRDLKVGREKKGEGESHRPLTHRTKPLKRGKGKKKGECGAPNIAWKLSGKNKKEKN